MVGSGLQGQYIQYSHAMHSVSSSAFLKAFNAQMFSKLSYSSDP